MKKDLHKVLAALLIGVFVNFVFANTVFVHTHTGIDGGVVTHSHPYMPSGSHSHSSSSLSLVANFNDAATAFEGEVCASLQTSAELFESLYVGIRHDCAALKATVRALRGPPMLG